MLKDNTPSNSALGSPDRNISTKCTDPSRAQRAVITSCILMTNLLTVKAFTQKTDALSHRAEQDLSGVYSLDCDISLIEVSPDGAENTSAEV